MSNPTNTHGGARPGAGRKPNAVKYQDPIYYAQHHCAARLTQTLATLESLADGTTQSVQERWVAAGTLTIGKGANERPAYPHLPPEQLVLVSRTTTTPKPDTRAATYLADRVMGRPVINDEAMVEERLNGELQVFIQKINARFSPELARTIFQTISEPLDPQVPVDSPLPEDQLWYENTPDQEQEPEENSENDEAEDGSDTPLSCNDEPQPHENTNTASQNQNEPLSSSGSPSVSPCLCGESPCNTTPKMPPNSTFQDEPPGLTSPSRR